MAAALTGYFQRYRTGDTTLPSGEALASISRALDAAALDCIHRLTHVLQASNEHAARVGVLQAQPRSAGRFTAHKILLQDASGFEQMVAINDWLTRVRIRDNHTFFLSAPDDDYIPVQVKKYAGLDANMMHVRLGATSGAHKAPKYTDWAVNNPWQDRKQKVFIYALEGLETVRQPHFSAATMIKGNAFENECIDESWRYGDTYACVEGKGQSKAGQPTSTGKKVKSAGLNLTTLTKDYSNATDPLAVESDFCLNINYEDYSDDGYADDLVVTVSPGDLVQAAETAIEDRDTTELNRLMENLVIAKLPPPQTPLLRTYIAGQLVANNPRE